MWTDPGNIQIAHRQMNVEIGTEAAHSAQFPEKEYINGIFVAVCLTFTVEDHRNLDPLKPFNCLFWAFENLKWGDYGLCINPVQGQY